MAALLLATAAFTQNLVVDYDFNPTLRDNTSDQNHLNAYGTGSSYAFVPMGSTNLNSDTCVTFNAGIGLRSDHAIYNGGWSGAAVSFWIQSSSQNATSTTGFVIQGAYAGFGIRMQNGNFVPFFNGTSVGAMVSNFQFSFSNLGWHHIVAQNNGDTTYLYVDGLLDKKKAETLYTMSAPDTNARLYIGNAVTNGSNDKLDGLTIDELKFYDGILSPAQIQQLILHQDIVAGVEGPKELSMSVYPNPAHDRVTWRVGEQYRNGTVTVLNALGQMVASHSIQDQQGEIALPEGSGIYFLRLEVDGRVGTQRIIKQ